MAEKTLCQAGVESRITLSGSPLEQPGRILGFLARAPSGHIDVCYSWLYPKEVFGRRESQLY